MLRWQYDLISSFASAGNISAVRLPATVASNSASSAICSGLQPGGTSAHGLRRSPPSVRRRRCSVLDGLSITPSCAFNRESMELPFTQPTYELPHMGYIQEKCNRPSQKGRRDIAGTGVPLEADVKCSILGAEKRRHRGATRAAHRKYGRGGRGRSGVPCRRRC